jgi:hypothetical protein
MSCNKGMVARLARIQCIAVDSCCAAFGAAKMRLILTAAFVTWDCGIWSHGTVSCHM